MRPHIWSLKLLNRWSDIDHDSLPESHPLETKVRSLTALSSLLTHIFHINPTGRAVISNICTRCSRISEHSGYFG